MEFVIVTGMSGAGKSAALRCFEDIDYFCIDNLPINLITPLVESQIDRNSGHAKIALGIDARGVGDFKLLFQQLDNLDCEYKILFLDAKDDTLLQRYKETRRLHPLAKDDGVEDGLKREREILEEVFQKADYRIDTSYFLPRVLKDEIIKIFAKDNPNAGVSIRITSFGHKFGIPKDTDIAFDARFIPNPFYLKELRDKTGNDKEVQEYVMSHPQAQEFFVKLTEMVDYLMPFYIKEDKHHLVVAIGCTGGKHRSVTIANKLYDHLKNTGYNVMINHRDAEIPNRRL